MSLMDVYRRELARLFWGGAFAHEGFLEQFFSPFREHQNTLEGLLKLSAGPHRRVSDPVCLRWGPKICISD